MMSAMKAITKVLQIFLDHRRTSPFKKIRQKKNTQISIKQHAMNTIEAACIEYQFNYRMHQMQQMAYRGHVQAFKRLNLDLLFVYGSSVKKLVGPENFKEFHIRQKLKCIDQMEGLYYGAGFSSCCSHCGTKCASKLSCGTNEYPICSDCVKKEKQSLC